MPGQRHLIECHCVLPIYKNKKPVVYHKFSVYSKIDLKSGKIIPKYVNCNNCGITHFVDELCKSQIKVGKEDVGSIRDVKEVSVSLPDKILNVIKDYSPTIDVYEEIEDTIDNSEFPKSIVLKREILDEKYHLKILNILSESKIKISSEIIDDIIVVE